MMGTRDNSAVDMVCGALLKSPTGHGHQVLRVMEGAQGSVRLMTAAL